MKRVFNYLVVVLFPLVARSQEILKVQFGDVTKQELTKTHYEIDPDAGAVVLFDKGQLDFVADNKGWFDVRLRRHCRIHILKNSGFDAATVEVPLYHRGRYEERISQIEAVTYHLENGKIQKTEMDKKAIFEIKHDKHFNLTKFTLPNVKEGVIIEFKYQVKSDFIKIIDPWYFQGSFPVLCSELTFEVPQFFGYVSSIIGKRNMDYNPSRVKNSDYTLNLAATETQTADWATLSCSATEIVWGMKNVEALNREPLMTSYKNYREGIGFQLSEFKYPLQPQKITSDWGKFNQELMEDEKFGKQISGPKNEVQKLLAEMDISGDDPLLKARTIFAYIRDHFKVIEGGGFYFENSIKTVIENKSGKANEVNLTLVSALQHAGLDAEVVLFSTRDHGRVNETYPLTSNYNGVLCRLKCGDKMFILDASEPGLGFGQTVVNKRNGYARIIGKSTETIYINPDAFNEKDAILVKFNEVSEGTFEGAMEYRVSPSNSHYLRVSHNLNEEEIVLSTAGGLDRENIKAARVDSLMRWDSPLVVSYKFEQYLGADSFLYFNPFQWVLTNENPFNSKVRKFPVEFPNLSEELYICILPVPKGYVIESMPKNQSFAIDDKNSLTFEIRCSESAGQITVRSKLKINKCTFLVDEYAALKETLDFVVNRHSEQIVFKKQ